MRKAGVLWLLFALCASLSAQELSVPSSSPETPSSGAISTEPETSWQTLEMLLKMLEDESTTLEESSSLLKESLRQALDSSKLLSTMLQSSATQLQELKSSLALSDQLLKDSNTSLKSVQAEALRLNRGLNLWRGVGIAGFIGLAGALVWGFVK